MLHSYRTKVQWVTTKYLTQRSNVGDARATTCFFYIPTISTNKRYENLAASIGSTMKPLTRSILMIFNSSEGSTYLECVSRSWEAVNNHMHSCKSPDKPVRQVRKLSEVFELKHSNYMARRPIN